MYLKNVLDAEKIVPSKKTDAIADKKKKKMLEMKEKQKLALINHKIEEDGKAKLDLECIFCKNADEGEPYLLGHFKYNNFFSKNPLNLGMPLM